jgi:hypothetical protein
MRRRKHRTDPIESVGEPGERRRSGRGLGPFSGGQLTIIIIAVVVMVGLPVGAYAVVSGSNSFITDATSGVRAHVTSTGQLQTHPNGPLTVTGVARPANAVDLFTKSVDPPSDAYCTAIAPPPGHALIVTSVKVSSFVWSPTAPTRALFYLYRVAGDCNGNTQIQQIDLLSTGNADNATVPFASGLVIPDGAQLTVWAYTVATPAPGQTDLSLGLRQWTVTVNGYQVPDASCPTFQSCLLGQ